MYLLQRRLPKDESILTLSNPSSLSRAPSSPFATLRCEKTVPADPPVPTFISFAHSDRILKSRSGTALTSTRAIACRPAVTFIGFSKTRQLVQHPCLSLRLHHWQLLIQRRPRSVLGDGFRTAQIRQGPRLTLRTLQALPPQWVNADLRDFDVTTLGKFDVLVADPPWAIHQEVRALSAKVPPTDDSSGADACFAAPLHFAEYSFPTVP